MKLKDIYIPACILLLFLFTSCEDTSSEDYPGESVPVPVSFSPLIADGINLGTTAATRASGTTWSAGDKVGIYMVANGTGNPTLPGLAGNYQYQIASDLKSLTPVSSPIYYPVDGSGVNFVAYYPYKASFATAHTYPVNVTTQDPLSAIDLLYCTRTSNSTPYSKTNTNASLTFRHQLVSLKVNVKGDTSNGVTSSHMTSPSFKITGMPRQATFPLSTGVLSAGTDVGEITPVRNTSASGASSTNLFWEGILVPNSSGTRSFVFVLGGTTYTYPVTQSFEAGKEYTFNLTLTTSGIIMNSIKIDAWNVGGAAWDGIYTLTVSESTITYDAEVTAGTIDIAYNTPNNPTTTGKPDWITNILFTKGGSLGNGFEKATMSYTLQPNTGATSRTGTMNMSVQGLTIPITVTQEAPVLSTLANCYMVYPGNMVVFPVTRAYEAGAIHGTLDEGYDGQFTVDVQWKDADVLADYYVINSGKNARIAVRAKSGSTWGNALLTLKDSNSNIVWSYHIWVTAYDPTVSTTTLTRSTNPRTTFMNYNLGATGSYGGVGNGGLFYQWGRKDPFPKEASLSGFSIASSGRVSIATTIKKPGVFNPYSSSPYDWNSSPNANLWCTTDDKKTLYDPCPAGWRVPTSGSGTNAPWYGLAQDIDYWKNEWKDSVDTPGFLWSGYWPAAGFRYYGSGVLSPMGTDGNYWSATANGSYGYGLSFSNGYVSPSNSTNRAYGRSVRCVSES